MCILKNEAKNEMKIWNGKPIAPFGKKFNLIDFIPMLLSFLYRILLHFIAMIVF